MQTIDVESWEQLEATVQGLTYPKRKVPGSNQPRFLFRGQNDADWHLTTTLERWTTRHLSFAEYFHTISRLKPLVETFTGTTWAIPEPPEYIKWLKDFDTAMPIGYPGYDYMVYLRHHGFPSPLLDWSRSLHVATYFAFREPPLSDRVAVFAYIERPTGLKTYSSGAPAIWSKGPYIRSHKRHFLQQCEYTICIVRKNEWHYASHEEAFGRNNADQDLLWKLQLPSSQRPKVLRALDAYNLNAFSLFGSEEALMETAAIREFQFSRIDELSNQALQPSRRCVAARHLRSKRPRG